MIQIVEILTGLWLSWKLWRWLQKLKPCGRLWVRWHLRRSSCTLLRGEFWSCCFISLLSVCFLLYFIWSLCSDTGSEATPWLWEVDAVSWILPARVTGSIHGQTLWNQITLCGFFTIVLASLTIVQRGMANNWTYQLSRISTKAGVVCNILFGFATNVIRSELSLLGQQFIHNRKWT